MSGVAVPVFLSLLVFSFSIFIFWWGVILPRKKEKKTRSRKLSRREFRRTIISALMILVSALIFISVIYKPFFKDNLDVYGYYWLVVFTLLFGIIILAIFDSIESLRSFLTALSDIRNDSRGSDRLTKDDYQKILTIQGSNNGKGHSKIDKNV